MKKRDQTLYPLQFLAYIKSLYCVSLSESNALYLESLALARELGDRCAIGQALVHLGLNSWFVGDYRRAEQQSREAIDQFKKIEYLDGVALVLYLVWVRTNPASASKGVGARSSRSVATSRGFSWNGQRGSSVLFLPDDLISTSKWPTVTAGAAFHRRPQALLYPYARIMAGDLEC